MPIVCNSSDCDVNETLRKEAFDAWHNSSDYNNEFPEDLSAVSPFAMYTFDAVWTLIQALHKSSLDNKSPSIERSPHCFDNLLKNSRPVSYVSEKY